MTDENRQIPNKESRPDAWAMAKWAAKEIKPWLMEWSREHFDPTESEWGDCPSHSMNKLEGLVDLAIIRLPPWCFRHGGAEILGYSRDLCRVLVLDECKRVIEIQCERDNTITEDDMSKKDDEIKRLTEELERTREAVASQVRDWKIRVDDLLYRDKDMYPPTGKSLETITEEMTYVADDLDPQATKETVSVSFDRYWSEDGDFVLSRMKEGGLTGMGSPIDAWEAQVREELEEASRLEEGDCFTRVSSMIVKSEGPTVFRLRGNLTFMCPPGQTPKEVIQTVFYDEGGVAGDFRIESSR